MPLPPELTVDGMRFRNTGPSGRSESPVMGKYEDWKIEKDKYSEFVELIDVFRGMTPTKLEMDDLSELSGRCYRGMNVIFFLLTLYKFGINRSVIDMSVNTESESQIFEFAAFVTEEKDKALEFANEYIQSDGIVKDNKKKIDEKIMQKVSSDNDDSLGDLNDGVFQPFVAAYNGTMNRDRFLHKGFEGVLYTARPNQATLKLFERITNLSEEEIKNRFPIFASFFDAD